MGFRNGMIAFAVMILLFGAIFWLQIGVEGMAPFLHWSFLLVLAPVGLLMSVINGLFLVLVDKNSN